MSQYRSESRSLRLDALLPMSASATLSVGWGLDLSLYGRFEGLVWQVATDPIDVNYLYKMQDVRAGMSIRKGLVGPVGVTLDGGAHLWRRMSFRPDAETQVDVDVAPSPYVGVSVDLAAQ